MIAKYRYPIITGLILLAIAFLVFLNFQRIDRSVWGSPYEDYGIAITIDNSNQVIVGGLNWVDSGVNNGSLSFLSPSKWIKGIFIHALDSSGFESWSFSSANSHSRYIISDIAACPNDDIIVNGYYSSCDEQDSSNDYDVWLERIKPGGSTQWIRFWGDNLNDFGLAIALDGLSCIYMVGQSNAERISLEEQESSNAWPFYEGDCLLSKYGLNGVLLYDVRWENPGDDLLCAVDCLPDGSAIVGGYYTEEFSWDISGVLHSINSVGEADCLLMRVNETGNVIWTRSIGSRVRDIISGISCNEYGHIFATGYFQEYIEIETSSGIDVIQANGGKDVFIAELDENGVIKWIESFGGSGDDHSYSIYAGHNGAVYVAGSFENVIALESSYGVDTVESNGNSDAFLVKYNAYGDYQWIRTWGTKSFSDYGRDVVEDKDGRIFVTGEYEGDVFLYAFTADGARCDF